MSFHRRETTRQAYIRILSEHSSGIDSLVDDVRDDVIRSELWRGEYLDGVVIMRDDGGDLPKSVSIRHVLPQGRLLLEQLKRDESEASAIKKLERWGLVLLGFVIGSILAPLFIEYLKKRLGL